MSGMFDRRGRRLISRPPQSRIELFFLLLPASVLGLRPSFERFALGVDGGHPLVMAPLGFIESRLGYRVLRRLVPREIFTSSIGQNTKTGILLDVETTGLDQQKDEIIELGMVKFDYLPDGRIASLREVYTSFNEPSEPIPLEVTALTGITDDMVAGQRIDDSAVFSFVDDAVIVIAHNASFDRKFVERYWSIFQRKAWGCSATEVEWRKHGFEGSRLGYLLNGAGIFHQAHRAVDDCHALLEILACELPTTGTSALAVLLERARKKTMRVWAEQSPFDLKDSLKRRGYRWSDGSDGRPRS